jgi:hypothetical protein
MIVPFGKGLCIINEQLLVTNARDERSKVSMSYFSDISLLRVHDYHRALIF